MLAVVLHQDPDGAGGHKATHTACPLLTFLQQNVIKMSITENLSYFILEAIQFGFVQPSASGT
jgi:hypothetical protein